MTELELDLTMGIVVADEKPISRDALTGSEIQYVKHVLTILHSQKREFGALRHPELLPWVSLN